MKTADLIRFIEDLPCGGGDQIGEPYKLLPYQKSFLRGTFNSGVLRAVLSLGRGGGKSGLLSAICLAALLPDSPLHRPGFETIAVASSFSQALLIGRSVKTSLEIMGKQFGKRGEFRVRDSQNIFEIENNSSRARFKVIGSDSKRAHGLRPNLAVLDEPAQHVLSGAALYSALRTALGKRRDGKLIAIGTRSENPDHWFERLLKEQDPAVFSMCFSADKEDDWGKVGTWEKANPGMREGFPDIEVLKAEARLARTDPEELQSFKELRLKQGTSDVQKALLVDSEEWRSAEVLELPERRGRYCLGVDLGYSKAFSACAAYWFSSYRLEGFVACGGVPSLQEHAKSDRVGNIYQEMLDRGELAMLGNRVVPVEDLLHEAIRKWGPPACIVADRYRQGELLDGIQKSGLRLPYPIFRGQGWLDGSVAVRGFKKELFSERIKAPESLAMRTAFMEARVRVDENQNEKLAKGSEAGRKQRGRDDLVAAILLAVSESANLRPKTPPRKLRYFKA